MRLLLVIILNISILIFPLGIVNAAVFYMEPTQAQYGPGDDLAVDIKMDVGSDCINTVEINLAFPQNHIKATEVITGDSIVNLWIEKPNSSTLDKANKEGLLHFAGGIPGGFCGRIPGDPGYSNLIARVVFHVPGFSVGEESVSTLDLKILDNARALINDGLGTADKLVIKNVSYALAKSPQSPQQNWQEQIASDKTQPEPFVIELHRSQNMYDNQYYIIFTTIDKQSGVDRYEIREFDLAAQNDLDRPFAWWEKLIGHKLFIKEPPTWKEITIPYVLEDQTLHSIISVRAVDKAGNERIAEYIPEESMRPVSTVKLFSAQSVFWPIATAVLIVIIILTALIIKIKTRKKQ